MIGKIFSQIWLSSTATVFPALYLSTVDLFSDPVKILGALAIVVQIGYVSSKTWIIWRREKDREDNE